MKTKEYSLRLDTRPDATLRAAQFALLLLALLCAPAHAQNSSQTNARGSVAARPQKLPSPDKIVGDYAKAIGGKKRLAALRDATYEWNVLFGEQEAGTARTQLKAPASERGDITLPDVQRSAAANGRSAWVREPDGVLRTLTDREAHAAKLQAMLDASRLVDFKKQKILARTAAIEQVGNEPVYVVEFSTRAGARIRHYFSANTKLLIKSVDEARGLTLSFSDYRAEGDGQILEPHRVVLERQGGETLTLVLREARYNTGLADSLFEPPNDANIDVAALLRELGRNQEEVDKRVNDYTFTRKLIERKINDKGEVTKETVTVSEVYPFAGWGWVTKLISENGVPLTPERAAKEEKRVAEALEKAEREAPKSEQKREAEKAKREAEKAKREAKRQEEGKEKEDGDDVGISTFLRASELVSSRRERFRDRDSIVFDFRPRPGFRPSNRGESIVSKLTGTVWIDPVEHHVMRLEARFTDGFKVVGGLFAIKSGSAFIFEQTRLPEGVWLPRFTQVNLSAKAFFFKGISVNETQEFSDFKRFSTKYGETTLDAPKKQ